jgi:NADH-quinone oxidoreductase subunit G
MKHMIIDGVSCEFENARNVLEVAQQNGIEIPNLCYCENLSIYGGCRMCVVENEKGAIEASCTMRPKDGMIIKTNTAKLRKYRRMILELLLASHRVECTTCDQSGHCKLQEYANRYGVHRCASRTTTARSPRMRPAPPSSAIPPSASCAPSASECAPRSRTSPP